MRMLRVSSRPWPRVALPLVVGAVAFAPLREGEARATKSAETRASTLQDQTAKPKRAKRIIRHYVVEGMTCEGCTEMLASYLEDQQEIRSVTLTFANKKARIEFRAGITKAETDEVMARVSKDWEGSYRFSPAPSS